MRIVDFLDKGAYLHPDRAFSIDANETRTYAQMVEDSFRVARALAALGASETTKVAVLSPNCNAVLECIYGLDRAGAIRVPINCKNGLEENIEIINDFDVDLILYHSSQEQLASQLAGACASQCLKLARIDGSDEGSVTTYAKEVADIEFDETYRPLKVVSIYPTGGTTGKPKGVMHTSQNWLARTANFVANHPIGAPPIHLVVAPLTHGAGSISISLTAQGATHVILDGFDALEVMEAIEQHRVSHLFLPPTALYVLTDHPRVREFDYSSLRYLIYGAAPSSPQRIALAISIFGEVLTHSYAQTEALAISYLAPVSHRPADCRTRHLMFSCGKPCATTDVRIIKPNGEPAAIDEPGEIQVRGAVVMAGYYKNPEATHNALRNGWLRTGDVGHLDAQGYLYIVDRLKDMIITGGFNVFPAEIERVACEYENVHECAVVGAPHPKWGEAVTMVIEAKAGRTVDMAGLKLFCRTRLGGVKMPKAIEVWDRLPRSPAGKVLKREIRAHFWKNADGRKI
jgi:acyl-CoA synthetase (AMP-forming)/AMP-acid ligase II